MTFSSVVTKAEITTYRRYQSYLGVQAPNSTRDRKLCGVNKYFKSKKKKKNTIHKRNGGGILLYGWTYMSLCAKKKF